MERAMWPQQLNAAAKLEGVSAGGSAITVANLMERLSGTRVAFAEKWGGEPSSGMCGPSRLMQGQGSRDKYRKYDGTYRRKPRGVLPATLSGQSRGRRSGRTLQ